MPTLCAYLDQGVNLFFEKLSAPHPTVSMIVTANTNPAPGAVALPSTNTKQETEEEEEPIKCKYMRAAHGYLRWVGRHLQCEHMLSSAATPPSTASPGSSLTSAGRPR